MFSLRTLVSRQERPTARPAFRRYDYQSALRRFRQRYPAYDRTRAIDELRARDFRRLDRQGHAYLDYTGGSLYAETLLRDHQTLLRSNVFGNPHSKNLTSLAMTDLVERARARVLAFFNAAPDEYMAIFTPNATGALRLVGEAYPFGPGGAYALSADNHNSVNGIREFARAAGAEVRYIPLDGGALRLDRAALDAALDLPPAGAPRLFAYPAQSNFSGVQHPLELVERAQARGWDVLLDAAAFAPTNRLDLRVVKPDFVDLSFYKIFGYPTGVGCLLARHAAAAKLRRPWYAGGTITFSSVAAEDHYLTPGPAGYEDGTVNYLSMPAVEAGLDLIESVGIDTIHARVMALTGWLIDELAGLRHSNGRAVVQIYGPATTQMRGATVAVNFFDPEGRMVDCNAVEQLANAEKISLRAGCHCNPGAREAALGFGRADLEPCFAQKDERDYAEFLQLIDGRTTGVLRASLGLASSFADVYAYAQFARRMVDRPVA